MSRSLPCDWQKKYSRHVFLFPFRLRPAPMRRSYRMSADEGDKKVKHHESITSRPEFSGPIGWQKHQRHVSCTFCSTADRCNVILYHCFSRRQDGRTRRIAYSDHGSGRFCPPLSPVITFLSSTPKKHHRPC